MNTSGIVRLLISIVIIAMLGACSSSIERSSPPKLKVKAKYFSVRNDATPFLSSQLRLSTELNLRINEQEAFHRVFLGHAVALICDTPNNCGQSSNLAKLKYTMSQDGGILIVSGKMINETGVSTTSQSEVGFNQWTINEGANLYHEGTVEQEFTLPIIKNRNITLTGPLGDKLILYVEPM